MKAKATKETIAQVITFQTNEVKEKLAPPPTYKNIWGIIGKERKKQTHESLYWGFAHPMPPCDVSACRLSLLWVMFELLPCSGQALLKTFLQLLQKQLFNWQFDLKQHVFYLICEKPEESSSLGSSCTFYSARSSWRWCTFILSSCPVCTETEWWWWGWEWGCQILCASSILMALYDQGKTSNGAMRVSDCWLNC